MEIGAKYLMFLLGSMANSFNVKKKTELKWVVICVIVFMLIEIDILYRDTDAPDVFDTLLPQFTICDRMELLKILMIPFSLIVK